MSNTSSVSHKSSGPTFDKALHIIKKSLALTASDKAIIYHILNFNRTELKCIQDYETIAFENGMSLRSINSIIKKLVTLHIIDSSPFGNGNKRRLQINIINLMDFLKRENLPEKLIKKSKTSATQELRAEPQVEILQPAEHIAEEIEDCINTEHISSIPEGFAEEMLKKNPHLESKDVEDALKYMEDLGMDMTRHSFQLIAPTKLQKQCNRVSI